MRAVPLIDASGVGALRDFANHCRRRGIKLILAEASGDVLALLQQMNFRPGEQAIVAATMSETKALAASLAAQPVSGKLSGNAPASSA